MRKFREPYFHNSNDCFINGNVHDKSSDLVFKVNVNFPYENSSQYNLEK
jgi:hypothetical protein